MSEFYLFRSTTPNLAGHLQHIEESGDTILSLAFVGEKSWIAVCRKGDTSRNASDPKVTWVTGPNKAAS